MSEFESTFEFDGPQLVAFSTGTFDQQVAAIKASVNANPKWTDTEVVRFLDLSGALFSPTHRRDLLNKIHHSDLKLFIGDFSIINADFRSRDLNQMKEVGDEFAMLEWIVSVRTNKNVDYTLGFEPMNGRLNWLRRVLQGATKRSRE
jgi:hypothetical protein